VGTSPAESLASARCVECSRVAARGGRRRRCVSDLVEVAA